VTRHVLFTRCPDRETDPRRNHVLREMCVALYDKHYTAQQASRLWTEWGSEILTRFRQQLNDVSDHTTVLYILIICAGASSF
jgi:hypothetical protein